jgi:putative iron-regulated protein
MILNCKKMNTLALATTPTTMFDMNALGILNVYNGSYQRTDGTTVSGVGIHDVLMAKDATVATLKPKASIESSEKRCLCTIAAPFDQQILSSNVAGRTAYKQHHHSPKKSRR